MGDLNLMGCSKSKVKEAKRLCDENYIPYQLMEQAWNGFYTWFVALKKIYEDLIESFERFMKIVNPNKFEHNLHKAGYSKKKRVRKKYTKKLFN